MIYTCYHAFSAAVIKREVSDEAQFSDQPEVTSPFSYTTSETTEVNH